MASKPEISANALSLMLLAAVAESLLSVYQWMELMLVRAGGTATCAINQTVNCTTVWTSDFATALHGFLKMPVAGLGLVWGLTAFGITVVLARRVWAQTDAAISVAAAKVWAGLGLLGCVVFAAASFKMGAVCLTCLGTYALTLGFALPALLLLPRSSAWRPALGLIVVVGVPTYAVLLWPGMHTATSTTAVPKEQAPAEEVTKFFENLPAGEAQAVSDARTAWKNSPTPDTRHFVSHQRYGPADAPVKLVEFTDILCSHCRALMQTLDELKKVAPPGNLSIEPRYFPLDGECNKNITQSPGDGVRCLGAKAQICLEGSPQFWTLRDEMFENQNQLTKEKILEIAGRGMPAEALQTCIASAETQARLDEDVAYAMLFNPEGTPVVLINGRQTLPVGTFLFGMVMAKGNADSAFFAKLPPPRQ